jgi:hypothetical protein
MPNNRRPFRLRFGDGRFAPADTVSNVVHEAAVRRPSEREHRSLVNNSVPTSLRLRSTYPFTELQAEATS